MRPELSQSELESRDAAAMSILRGTSLTKPLQVKRFSVENDIEVWVDYEVNGKTVHLIAGVMTNSHFAIMAAEAMNMEQKMLLEEEVLGR